VGTYFPHRVLVRKIYDLIYEPIIKAYWMKKHHLSTEQWEGIDWEAAQKVVETLPPGSKR
jgi:hypothetical protein